MYVINGSAGQAVKNNERIMRNDELINMIDDIQYFRMEDHHPNYDLGKPLFDYDAIRKMSIDENNPEYSEDYIDRCECKYENILDFEQYDPKINLQVFLNEIPIPECLLVLDNAKEIAEFIVNVFKMLCNKFELHYAIVKMYEILCDLYLYIRMPEYREDDKVYILEELFTINADVLVRFIYNLACVRYITTSGDCAGICIESDTSDYSDMEKYINVFTEIMNHSDDDLYRNCIRDVFHNKFNIRHYCKFNVFLTIESIQLLNISEFNRYVTDEDIKGIIRSQYDLFRTLDTKTQCVYAQLLFSGAYINASIKNTIEHIYDEQCYKILISAGVENSRYIFNNILEIHDICFSIDGKIKNILQNNFYDDTFEYKRDWFKYINNNKTFRPINIQYHRPL